MKLGLKQKVFSRIGTKIGGLGQLGLKHSGTIASAAGVVEGVADKVASAAGTGATLAALSGLGVPVATALGSVAAGAKGVAKGAEVVGGVAGKAATAQRALNFMDRF